MDAYNPEPLNNTRAQFTTEHMHTVDDAMPHPLAQHKQ
jgi:hypothetical protein